MLTKVDASSVAADDLEITDLEFHHVAVAKSGGTVTFYLDGRAGTPRAYDPGFTFATGPAIGMRSDTVGNGFYGAVDELGVFDRALSAAEVRSLFEAGSAGRCLPPRPLAPGVVYGRRAGTTGSVWWFDPATGEERRLADGVRPRVSPEGRWLLFLRDKDPFANRGNLYVRDLQFGAERRVFTEGDYLAGAGFSADGTQIVFDHSCGIYRMNRDGSGVALAMPSSCFDDGPSVDPVTGRIAFHNVSAGQLGVANADGSDKRYLPASPLDEAWPVWSPDGEWIAAVAGEFYPTQQGAGNLIKVRPDGTGFLWLTTVTNANEGFYNGAAWMPDGQSLLAAGTVNGTNGVYVIAADGSGIRSRLNTPAGDPLDWVGAVIVAPDTTPPVLHLPDRLVTGCGTEAGTVVRFEVTATDDRAGPVRITCEPPSGSVLPPGTIWVACTATDAAGNVAHGEFPVTVLDSTTAPLPTLTSILPTESRATARRGSGCKGPTCSRWTNCGLVDCLSATWSTSIRRRFKPGPRPSRQGRTTSNSGGVVGPSPPCWRPLRSGRSPPLSRSRAVSYMRAAGRSSCMGPTCERTRRSGSASQRRTATRTSFVTSVWPPTAQA
ncbi:MAG: HYR domain-containing protein [Verrucomicrobia bacterium]|nr:HYR domain-containing protein [Verrucomicrobiota bacterium]